MWSETTLGILYVQDEEVQFSDDFDHWKNGFCRLLEISDEQARSFVEEAVVNASKNYQKLFSKLDPHKRLDCLSKAATKVLYSGRRPRTAKLVKSWGTDLEGTFADMVFAHSISGDKTRLVVGNSKHEFAWLVDSATDLPVAAKSITYDAAYYDAGTAAHLGPKDYLAVADWRIEKANRLAGTVLDGSIYRKKAWLKNPESVNVLDVGAGLGYMRKAFADYGFKHYGTEVSPQIASECASRFGFETWLGGLERVAEMAQGMRFNIITLWDVIEHLDDAEAAIRQLKEQLTQDGVIVIRTPNLMSIEREILGDFYYSFKLDHIVYFSSKSLSKMMRKLGLTTLSVETSSHLFKGFLGANYLYKIGTQMKGADILAIYAAEER